MSRTVTKGAAYTALIANRQLIALDIETTTVPGPTGGPETYPVSVGAVLLLNGTRRRAFHTLMDPGVEVDDASSAHNHITTPDLVGQPDPATALAALNTYLAPYPDAILVCHNARFDISHLATAYARAGMTPLRRTVIDTQFLPIRLHIPGSSPRSKLTHLASQYGAATTLTGIPTRTRRLHKGLQDAQDTAEVLSCLLAEAAAQGITDFDEFLRVAKAKTTEDIAAAGSHPRRHRTQAPASAKHIATAHRNSRLTTRPGVRRLDAWTAQLGACITEHCPHAAEKVLIEARRAGLLDRVTGLLRGAVSPGDMGTLLGAIEPLLTCLDREGARQWYRANHQTIKGAPACDYGGYCPHCATGQPCPQDTTVLLLTRRALDYGTVKRTGEPISLFSHKAKNDLWDPGRARKMDTWPSQGMHDMAAHMMWLLIDEANRKHMSPRRLDILNKAVKRSLHVHDPRLALEVARHWATDPNKDPDIAALVEMMRAQATTDPGYLELDMWFDGCHKRTIAARQAAARRKARPPPKGLRKPSPVELRPASVQHSYRYQLRRPDTTLGAAPPVAHADASAVVRGD